MFSFLVFTALCASCLAYPVDYSFSPSVGYGSGTSFSITGEGRITGIRIWEAYNAYITGIQLSFNNIWSERMGRSYGHAHQLDLFENEKIIQVSGKYHSNYIYQLIFQTSFGRSLIVGQPYQCRFWSHSHTSMFSFLVFTALCASCLAYPVDYSFSPSVGYGSGTSFSITGEGRITGIRIWEAYNAYITGIQLSFNNIWSERMGRSYGHAHQLDLFENEKIIEVSGKYYSNYIYQLIFRTSFGRSLIVGQPYQCRFWSHSHTSMFSFLVFTALCASCLAYPVDYSFSPSVGFGSRDSFSITGEGRITGIRIWEAYNAYITGIQLSFNNIWSERVGRSLGPVHQLDLFENEKIIQVSGKYHSNYIYQLIFQTSFGRSLIVGQPYQRSFNMYPAQPHLELIMLSGRANSFGITALAAHWGGDFTNQKNSDALPDIPHFMKPRSLKRICQKLLRGVKEGV
ncbi:uncharacterized protein V6R79_004242 [Siganus canaliculatus]